MTGLLTFIQADNYGALLQAYALQQTLNVLGHENEFLNIGQPDTPADRDLSHVPAPIRKKMEETIRNQKQRSELFADFKSRFLNVAQVPTPEESCSWVDSYERFIVGSDQVWNNGITGGNPIYTLAFAPPEKRYSYAASFGGNEGLGKATESFWRELSRFRKISLREDTATTMCIEKTGIEPLTHVDPCLLRTKEQWMKLVEDENRNQTQKGEKREASEKFVLLFMISYDETMVQGAEAWAAEHGLLLKIVTASYIPMFGYSAFNGTGVIKWLSLILDAEYVFCDSFHAAVFSILFEKNFYLNIAEGPLSGRSARLVGLLSMCGLKPNIMNEKPDYEQIRAVIGEERQKSLAYLESIYQ